MCSICHSTPCLSACPNAKEPYSIGKCKYCGDPIYVGEEYGEIEGRKYHYECLGEFSVTDWLEIVGGQIKDAEI